MTAAEVETIATGEPSRPLSKTLLPFRVERMPEGEQLYPEDYLTDQPERVMAAEIVREKVLQFTHAELPFSSAVVIDRFEAPEETGQPDAPGAPADPSRAATRTSAPGRRRLLWKMHRRWQTPRGGREQ